ncbi:MAG: DUF1599 domain-containing protein [Bergeyella sp.]|nr:DUF1599 domain-containing protein [Bergeyella sp.]
MKSTSRQFENVISRCRSIFEKKLTDYGTAWRALRPSSITDQIFIKINRLRTLQITGNKKVEESEEEGYIAIVNYAVIGLIQLKKGFSDTLEEPHEEIMELYDHFAHEALELMKKKNHDYGEAWKEMRLTSITDLIYQKILRTKQIENNEGKTLASEGIEANYYDMINYAVFCCIKITQNI